MPKIEVKNVSKIFGPRPERALKLLEEGLGKKEIKDKTGLNVGVANASFNVEMGEILVVMGLSGSGKSTMLRCVNRLIDPTAGQVILDGRDMMDLDHKELLEVRRKKLGMVFQHFALLPKRTIMNNVAYGLEVQNVEKSEREQKAMKAIKQVGLDGWENSRPGQLSGGMQQRVGLARALALDPDIMLMDEPFSALDPLIRREMQDELLELQSRMHKTILFITHDLDEALKLGDRIVLMNEGRIVQVGTGEQILTNPASKYVEQFVEDVDRSRVLSAASVMNETDEVAYPNDGPRTALHKMREEGISGIFVVEKDRTLVGYLDAETAKKETDEKSDRKVRDFMRDAPLVVTEDEPLQNLLPMLAGQSDPLAVVDENNKLKGVVIKGSLLAGLAEGASNGNSRD